MATEPVPAGQPCADRPVVEPSADHVVGLNAPVRSLKMLELQIAGGATEVYLGLRPEDGPVSFDSLPANRDGEQTHVSSPALLGEIVTAAHTAGLIVHFCADTPVVRAADEAAFRRHVERGVAAGVDTLVVGSLPACSWLAGGELPVVAGGALGVSTPDLAAHLHEKYGVRRVVVPHTLALDEIALFCGLPGLEIETPVQTGAGLDCTRCRLQDTPGVGLGCRAGYRRADDPTGDLGGFLDGAADCALCDVPSLIALGVTTLQVAGRESPNLRQNAKITQMYRRALRGHAAGTPITEVIKEIDRVELMWQMGWLPRLCDQQRCRFRDTPQLRAYV